MRFSAVICAVSMLVTMPAWAQDAEDAAYDNFGGTVVDSQGDCVRTKWQGENDPCAPAPTPVATPQPKPKPEPLPVVTLEQRTVYFDFDSARLNADAVAKLNQLTGLIGSSSRVTGLVVHGYTDQLGSDAYNAALAAKRAQAVKQYLDTNSKLQSTVGEVLGLGKSSPAAECKAIKQRAKRIACMATERRVEVEVKIEQ